MKRLSHIFFMLVAFFLFTELIWFSCEPLERQQLLEALGRDDLVREISLDPYSSILVQIYHLRIEDYNRVKLQNEVDQLSTTTFVKKFSESAKVDTKSWQEISQHSSGKILCKKPKTQRLDNITQQKIYKWVDDKGRTHFGEKPSTTAAEDLSKHYSALQKEIQFSIEYPNWSGDKFLESEIKKQGKMVHKVLSNFVLAKYQRQINLKIILFKNFNDFKTQREKQKANVQWGAYYSWGNNSIYLPRYTNIEKTLAIARHEITHAILAGMIGPVPVWMNEGLAEYMESFSWQLNVAVVQPKVDKYARLKSRSLQQLARMERKDFYGSHLTMNYLQAGASLYFLLDHQAGREWVRRSFTFYGENPCRKVSFDQLFRNNYHGGIEGANRNFQNWLNQAKYSPHRY